MLFGITMGDSSGVGPEIILKSFSKGELMYPCVAYGDYVALARCNAVLGLEVPLHVIGKPSEYQAGALNVIDFALLSESQLTPGKLNAASGAAAREYVVGATRAALAGEIDAMVTLPMNKEATQLSDPEFVGHTELIGSLCGVKDVTIMLASDELIVTHVSTHVSLRRAIELVKKDRIATTIELTWKAVARLKEHPRIAVAGLNPHAGENGLFGDEDREEIWPAVKWANERGMPVEGPLPPDTLFYLAVKRKRYDVVICMYHDQGHIPSKLLDFEGGVNIALGVPIIRTSVDHGTAFDIAWKGEASTKSFITALNFAAKLSSLPVQNN